MTVQTNTPATATRSDLLAALAALVGHDGNDNLGVIVDCALAETPDVTVDELVEIVREAREKATQD